MPTLHRVTLLTGDTVHVTTRRNGKRSISLEPGPDGTMPEAAITEVGEHAYVVPRAALPLLAAHRLDLELFDVAALIDQRYDDEHRSTLPVIVDYGAGAEAAAESKAARLQHARKTVTLASLGAAAFAAEKAPRARLLALAHRRAERRRRLDRAGGGSHRVDLDGRVRATLDTSVAQIHAPEAWAAGFDGAGVDRGRARHGLRHVPPRPRRRGLRERQLHRPTRPWSTATATAPTSPRRSPAPARRGATGASRPARS